MDYKTLHWESIAFIRQYLAQRLLDLDLPQQTNILRAWSTLVQWKNGQKLDENARQAVSLTKLPGWFSEFLSRHAIIKNETLRAVLVYPDTFFEGIGLLISLAESIGELSHIMLSEATPPLEGVWVRVVFTPASGKPYESRQEVLQRLPASDPKTRVVATEFHAAEDFFEINHSRLGLQHNTRTGHQAFAVMLPLAGVQTDKPKIEPPKVIEAERSKTEAAKGSNEKPIDRIYKLLMSEKTNITLPTETPPREQIERAEDALAVIYQLLEDKATENRVEEIRNVLKTETLNLEALRETTTAGDTQPTKAVSLLVKVYDTLLKEPILTSPKAESDGVTTITPEPEAATLDAKTEVEAAKSSDATAALPASESNGEAKAIEDSAAILKIVDEALETKATPETQGVVQESATDMAAVREKEANGTTPKEA
ncbi:MAG: hypothetical protein H6673_10375 [Anaerolineales bacterium]|nr:hypothetical protein [Anaerolineales bacterium]